MQDSANEAISPWSLMHPSAKACVKVTIIAGKPRPVQFAIRNPSLPSAGQSRGHGLGDGLRE